MVHITHRRNNERGKSCNCQAEHVRPFPLCNFISFPRPSNVRIRLSHLLTSRQRRILTCTLAQLSPLPGMPALVSPKDILYFHPNSRLSFASSRQIYFDGVKEKKKRFMCFFVYTGIASYTCLLYMVHPSV